ncbi:MAG: phage tail protein [Telluria sp.]
MFAGNFAPVNWAKCDGSVIPISGNDALFALIGNTYGGDGQTTFGLPDLRGRAPMHKSPTYPIGSKGGDESVTLTPNQMPAHTHTVNASSTPGTASNPENAVWAGSFYTSFSTDQAPPVAMNPQAVSAAGGSQPHDNMMPYLVINYIICTVGIYPSFN